MANFIKPKIGIAVFSVCILALIPLLESRFFAPVTIKRWEQKLTWSDFQGIVQPFSKYEAAISSKIYFGFDSVKQHYHAYAGQNNIRSWARMSTPYLDYALNHEQYHFNVTEVHARMLNKYIMDNPGQTEYAYSLELKLINQDLRTMQDAYDGETEHGILFDNQRRWEYKIDSMLTLENGWTTDHFSGAKIYFPSEPTLSKGITRNGVAYRIYQLDKYVMALSLSSYQKEDVSESFLEDVVKSYSKDSFVKPYPKDSYSLLSVKRDSSGTNDKVFITSSDSANFNYSVWVKGTNYFYSVIAKFPVNARDTTGYAQNAWSFINSFEITNTDQFWINKYEQDSASIHHSKEEKGLSSDHSYCISFSQLPERRGFYRGPIFRSDGALLLANDISERADSLIYENILFVDTQLYSNSKVGLLFLPPESVPQGKYRMYFGYTLLKDSVENCYPFYRQSLNIKSNR